MAISLGGEGKKNIMHGYLLQGEKGFRPLHPADCHHGVSASYCVLI